MSTKVCRTCTLEKPETDFYLRKETGRRRTECSRCIMDRNNNNYAKKPEQYNKMKKASREPHLLKIQEKARDKYAENLEACREYGRNKYQRTKHRGTYVKNTSARRARKIQSTPAWSDQTQIRQIYEDAATMGLTVDHIIPLRGVDVCGLHTDANLQLLPSSENIAKGNKFSDEQYQEWRRNGEVGPFKVNPRRKDRTDRDDPREEAKASGS